MRHQLAPEAGRKGQRCLPSTQSRSGAENRLWFTHPSSPVLHVYLCAKMHFCIQHNRNRCGRFNINAVTNGRRLLFCPCVLRSLQRIAFAFSVWVWKPVCVFMAPHVSTPSVCPFLIFRWSFPFFAGAAVHYVSFFRSSLKWRKPG